MAATWDDSELEGTTLNGDGDGPSIASFIDGISRAEKH